MSVQQEMQKLTKLKTKGGESKQEYLTRLIIAMSDENLVSDDAIKAMSPEADEWYKAAGQAYDKQEPLPDFPDETAEEPEADEPDAEPPDFPEDEPEPEEDSEMAMTETTTKTKSAKKAATKTAAKGAAKTTTAAKKKAAANNSSGKTRAAATGSGRPMGDGARGQITAWLIKNPKLTNEQIHERLKKQGNKTSFVTVKSTRSALKSFITELQKAGHKINLQV